MTITRNILLNPGPATTTDTVKMAQVVPDICPREHEFGALMRSITEDLTAIAGGDGEYTTVLFGGSGSAAMDAVINSVTPPEKKILIINNGAYGERMVKIANAYQIECVEIQCSWDALPDLGEIETALQRDPDIAVVGMVHHETTTGLLNPVQEIGALVKQYQKVFVVDTISSFAGVPLDIKTCQMDFMMSTSNKCLQGMAGISFVICKTSELKRVQPYPRRSFYLSLYDQYAYFEKSSQMRFTPPVQTMYALRRAIDEFLEEGQQQRYDRYTQNWRVLREGMQRLGFRILTQPEQESHILITIEYPDTPGFDFDMMHDKLYERGFTIYPGKIGKKDTFRLANMGAITEDDIHDFLQSLQDVLSQLNIQLPIEGKNIEL